MELGAVDLHLLPLRFLLFLRFPSDVNSWGLKRGLSRVPQHSLRRRQYQRILQHRDSCFFRHRDAGRFLQREFFRRRLRSARQVLKNKNIYINRYRILSPETKVNVSAATITLAARNLEIEEDDALRQSLRGASRSIIIGLFLRRFSAKSRPHPEKKKNNNIIFREFCHTR